MLLKLRVEMWFPKNREELYRTSYSWKGVRNSGKPFHSEGPLTVIVYCIFQKARSIFSIFAEVPYKYLNK